MADVVGDVEEVQDGFAADGHGIVLWVESIADVFKPTAAEIAAGVRITYGLTPDGFSHDITINKVGSGRYTLENEIEYDGTEKHDVTLKYVYTRGTTPNEVQTLLGTAGVKGFLVHALGYPNGHQLAADDTVNAVIPVRTSKSKDVPATANTEATKEQKPNVTGRVALEVKIVA